MARLGVALIALKYIFEGAFLIALCLSSLSGQITLQEWSMMLNTLPRLQESLPIFLGALFGVFFCLIGVLLWEQNKLAFYTIFGLELLNIFLAETVAGKMVSLLILVYLLTIRGV